MCGMQHRHHFKTTCIIASVSVFCQIARLGMASAWASQTGSSRIPCGCLESQLPNQFQRPRTRHEGGNGMYYFTISNPCRQATASDWFSRLLRWLLRLCWVYVDVSVHPPGHSWSNCHRCDIGAWTIVLQIVTISITTVTTRAEITVGQ